MITQPHMDNIITAAHTHKQTHTEHPGLHPGICCDLALEMEDSRGWPLGSPTEPIFVSNWLLMSVYVCLCASMLVCP